MAVVVSRGVGWCLLEVHKTRLSLLKLKCMKGSCSCIIHRVPKKEATKLFGNNFLKSWPIFKILSLLNRGWIFPTKLRNNFHKSVVENITQFCWQYSSSFQQWKNFYPHDAMLARVIVIATCPSVCLSVRLSRAGIVSKRRKLAAWFLHHLVAPRL